MTIPEPWQALLLALATFRLVRLVAWDDLTIRPRRWITGMGDSQHHKLAAVFDAVQDAGLDPWDPAELSAAWEIARTETPELPHDPMPIPVSERRFYLSRMLRCAWCVGWWISLIAALGWYASHRWALLVALPFALSAIVGLTARWLDP